MGTIDHVEDDFPEDQVCFFFFLVLLKGLGKKRVSRVRRGGCLLALLQRTANLELDQFQDHIYAKARKGRELEDRQLSRRSET
jgi:hypothetical protein